MSLIAHEDNLVKFVVLTQGRTGSNMLVSMLDNHPDIQCFGEVLNPRSSFGYEIWQAKSSLRRIANKYMRDYCVEKYLDSFFTVRKEANTRAIGFKLIYPGQFDRWSNFRYYWRTYDFKVVSLIRHNLLRKHVSSKIANLEDVWSTQKKRDKALSVKIDVSELKRNLERMEIVYNQIKILTHEFRGIQVSYEELTSNREDTMRKLFQFLGLREVEPDTLNAKTVRQNPEKLDKLIENYDEVSSFLRENQYQRFLEESVQ